MFGLIVCVLLAFTVTLHAEGDFEWSWEDGAEGQEGQPGGKGLDPETYNQLLKENLELRRKLQDTDRGADAIQEENAALKRQIGDLEGKISTFSEQIDTLRTTQSEVDDPDKVVDLEAKLAGAEIEKDKMGRELDLLRQRLERGQAGAVAPAAGTQVKPGSDLFVALERENSDLRAKLTDVEGEKQKVLKQLRNVEAEAAAKDMLEMQITDASSESDRHKAVIRGLLQRIPALETDLAAAKSEVRVKDRALSRKEQQLAAMKLELERREHRLNKAARIAALLARTQLQVKETGAGRQRDLHYNMAVMYAGQGRYKEAEREYLRALRVDPIDADAHYNLAILYEEHLKVPRKAVSHYRRYLKLRPNAPDANEVRTWIVALETQ